MHPFSLEKSEQEQVKGGYTVSVPYEPITWGINEGGGLTTSIFFSENGGTTLPTFPDIG